MFWFFYLQVIQVKHQAVGRRRENKNAVALDSEQVDSSFFCYPVEVFFSLSFFPREASNVKRQLFVMFSVELSTSQGHR